MAVELILQWWGLTSLFLIFESFSLATANYKSAHVFVVHAYENIEILMEIREQNLYSF